ncbi:MAG TPA: hemolysin family protein [Candidatus Ruania gallistercoris]|uniref:Hemolysin family protein n=1 Tax=Candidatus Ruania gallistercoris TaxID=2838746 RepID=A0A9D2EFI1_9MICO|nr:hemolysin family protein [Candidatus Ruania gallistercoris]
MITDWLLVALGVLLTAGTALFVAAEFSLVALDPAAVDKRAGADRTAGLVQRAVRQLATELSGAQVGITLTTVLLGYTMQAALANLLTQALAITALAEAAAAAAIAVLASLVTVNTFSMLFGELVPKNWAIADPMRVARVVVGPQHAFTTALRPVISVLNGSANKILRLAGVEPREELGGGRSATELAALVRHSAKAGTLERSTALLLTRSIGFGELTAQDVMTDRMRMRTVRRDAMAAELVELARSTGHSRFPVIEASPDEVVGIVQLRRAIGVPHDRRGEVPVGALMDEAPQVPETARLAPLLVSLRNGLQMAVVVDEFGGTSGVVTLEDVVEELVGDVADEHDRRRRDVRAGGEESWLVPGTIRPDELVLRTGLRVPDEAPYETLGGLVMTVLGRMPQVGDEVEVPGVWLRVETMDLRRVETLRVRALPTSQPEEEE